MDKVIAGIKHTMAFTFHALKCAFSITYMSSSTKLVRSYQERHKHNYRIGAIICHRLLLIFFKITPIIAQSHLCHKHETKPF